MGNVLDEKGKVETFYEDGSRKTVTYFDNDGIKVCEFTYEKNRCRKYQVWHKNGQLSSEDDFDETGDIRCYRDFDETGKLTKETNYPLEFDKAFERFLIERQTD